MSMQMIITTIVLDNNIAHLESWLFTYLSQNSSILEFLTDAFSNFLISSKFLSFGHSLTSTTLNFMLLKCWCGTAILSSSGNSTRCSVCNFCDTNLADALATISFFNLSQNLTRRISRFSGNSSGEIHVQALGNNLDTIV